MTQHYFTPFAPLTRQSIAQLGTEITVGTALAVKGQQPIRRTYLDSFDGRLASRGIQAFWEAGKRAGCLVIEWEDGGASRFDGLDAPPRFVADVGGKPLRRVAELLDERALLPWAECRGERIDFVLGDDAASPDTPTRPRLEALTFIASDGSSCPLLRALPAEDNPHDEATRELLARLQGATEFAPEPGGSLAALLADRQFPLTWTPRPPSEPVTAASHAHRAVRTILQSIAATLEANTQGTIEQWDSEFLHDFRVALRRTRSVLGAYRSVLPPTRAARFQARFRTLGQLSGAARDLDLLERRFDALAATLRSHSPSALAPLRAALRHEGIQAHERLNRYLQSPAYRGLLAGWDRFLASKRRLPGSASESLGQVTQIRLEKSLARLVKLIRKVRRAAPPEALHEIRKRAKKLRYLLEIGSQFDLAGSPGALSKDLKSLQNALGEYQDTQAQLDLLRRTANRLNRLKTPTETLLASGALLETLAVRERDCQRAAIKRCRDFAKIYSVKRSAETKSSPLFTRKD